MPQVLVHSEDYFFPFEKWYVCCCASYTLHHSWQSQMQVLDVSVFGSTVTDKHICLSALQSKICKKIVFLKNLEIIQLALKVGGSWPFLEWWVPASVSHVTRRSSDWTHAIGSGSVQAVCAQEGEWIGRGTNKATALTFGLLGRGGHEQAALVEGTPHNQAPVSVAFQEINSAGFNSSGCTPIASLQGAHTALFKTHAHGTDSI